MRGRKYFQIFREFSIFLLEDQPKLNKADYNIQRVDINSNEHAKPNPIGKVYFCFCYLV